MNVWRTVRLWRWSIMVGRSADGRRYWLVTHDNGIIAAGRDLPELLGLRTSR